MKNIAITVIMVFLATFNLIYAQNINWESLDENQKNNVYINLGYDFGITTQFGYGYQLAAKKPILISADYSFPLGNNLLDDAKIRLGAQMPVLEKNGFIVAAKIYGIFIKHQTKLVRMANLGSELSLTAGYYKPSWHIAADFGFHKSISTHLKHSDLMKTSYPAIKDGWFSPSGGNFFYGIQAGKRLSNQLGLSLKLGATNAQLKDQNAVLPYYFQIGGIWKFSKK